MHDEVGLGTSTMCGGWTSLPLIPLARAASALLLGAEVVCLAEKVVKQNRFEAKRAAEARNHCANPLLQLAK